MAKILMAVGLPFAVAGAVVATVFAADQTIYVTINSDPPGATVFANRDKREFGHAPVRLTYKASKKFAERKGCMKLQSVMVRWASGVEESKSSIDLCPTNGLIQQVLFVRPAAPPGREIDEQFARNGFVPRNAPQPIVASPPKAVTGPRGPKTFYVTYQSEPEGAVLYTNGHQMMGYTPLRLKFDSPREFRDGTGCANLQPTEVRWVSGATASIDNLRACPAQGGEQGLSFARPTTAAGPVPGLELDLQFAFQRELLARLDAAAAAQASRDAWARAAASAPPTLKLPLSTSCTSQVIGQQIFTQCV
jgi:hypothetical protein